MSKTKKVKCSLVRVEWLDAYEESSGWHELKILDTTKCARCISVGYMIKKKDRITLFSDRVMDDNDVGRIMSIPNSWITDIKYFGDSFDLLLTSNGS